MFNFIFDAVSAWGQVMFIIGGVICLGLGALILFGTIQSRLRCHKVRARIVAVRCGGIVAGMENNMPKKEAEPKPQESLREIFKKSPAGGLTGLLFVSIIILVPVGLFAGGAYFGWNYLRLNTEGIRTEATVIGITTKRDSERQRMYALRVSYKDQNGARHRLTDKTSRSWKPAWKSGDKVGVFYDPQDPENFVIDAFWHNMALPFGLMGISGGILFFLFGWPHVKKRRDERRRLENKPQKFSMMEAVGRYYYPVYEYTGPDGETITAHTSSGSDALANKIPGTEKTILVNPNEPWEAEEPGILGYAIALIFALPGAFFFYMGFVNFTFTPITGGLLLAVAAFCGYKISKLIKPRSEWEKPSSFKQRRREERKKKMANPSGRILDEEEFWLRLDAVDRYTTIWLPFMLLIAAGLLWGGLYFYRDMERFSLTAQKTTGEVISITSRHNRGADSQYSYHPVVSFMAGGKSFRFEDRAGSNPPLYKEGDVVEVLYDPASPNKAKIDLGIFNNLPAAACFFFGALLLYGALKSWAGIRRRKYLARPHVMISGGA